MSRSDIDVVVVGRDDDHEAQRRSIRHLSPDQSLNPAEARNLGIRSTTAERIIFLDSDCLPEPGWLDAMLANLVEDRVIVSGAIRIVPDQYLRLAGNVSTFNEYTSGLPASGRLFLPTFSLGLHRRVISLHGGFDERLPRAEDLDFTIRMQQAGYRLRFEPAAAVVHRSQRVTWSGLIDHSILSGQCSIQVRRRYPDSFGMPQLLLHWPLLMVLAPVLALSVAARALMRNPDVRKYWLALPIVATTRFLWIIGACQYLREDSPSNGSRG
jgi:GT2 family glycosyltransferase